jgi:hypothetical protein
MCHNVIVCERHNERSRPPCRTTVGLDLAKHWFQVHGVDANGQVAVRHKLRRSEMLAFFQSLPPCLVGMEACATAHHWAPRADQARAYGEVDAGGVCESLRQA